MNAAAGSLGHFASFSPWRRGHDDRSSAGVLAALSTGTLLVFFLASWLVAPRSPIAQTAYLGVYLVSAVLCCVAARAGKNTALRWEYIAIAVISVPIAIMIEPRSDTIGDLIALAFYPAAAIAVTPRSRTIGSSKPAPELVDLVIVATGVITIAAYAAFLVLPAPPLTSDGLYRPLAPAAAVLVMLPAVIRLKASDGLRLSAGAGFLFSGLVISIATDVSTAGTGLSRFTWSVAVWLMGLGATVALRSNPPLLDAPAPSPPTSWWPAAAAGGVYALLASQFARVEPISSRVLIMGGTVVTGLLLVRQIAALRQNQHLLERIARHDKRDAVGRATADVAHEFNNLLTVMVGHIEVLDADLPSGHLSRANLDELRRAATNAVDLTRSLLGEARESGSATGVVDVNAVVQQVASMLQPSLGAGYDIGVTLGHGPCLARGDHHDLLRAIVNLIFNARDATPNGGSISIETSTAPAASLPTSLPLRQGDYICIAVRDSGVGMTDDVLARAFDPFFTTKPEGKGTGLGLALVFSAMRRSGGLVDVASVPGQGSTFTLWLPRAEHSAQDDAFRHPTGLDSSN
jgi:signal transduction histidine kinase